MSKKTASLSIDGKPLMVALSVLAVVTAAGEAAAAPVLNCAQGIEFGTLAACGVANTMTIEPDGGLTTSGCLSPVGNTLAGECSLFGIEDTTTVITVIGPGNLSNGAQNMPINNFRLQVSGSPTAVTVINVTPSMSNLNFGVGATINVGATQAGGTYVGTYTVNTNNP